MREWMRMAMRSECLRRLLGVMLVLAPVSALTVAPVGAVAATPVGTTEIADTVFHADGTPASGLVLVSWGAFTTAGGQTVPAGSVSAAIATGGAVELRLAPNTGALPAGSFYTAVYHLDDGSTSRETWLVPASAAAVTIAAVRSAVVPAAVAIQTVTKSYVDNAIAAAVEGGATPGTIPFVTRAGDTMTGPLTLPGDPTAGTQAASKHYVDASVGAVASGLTQVISTAPAASQTVTQPQGTQLVTNRLNGALYASQYQSGLGNNGVANVTAGADCATGCVVLAEPTYGQAEGYDPAMWKSSAVSGTHVQDDRGAERRDTYLNPLNPVKNGNDVGQVVTVLSTRSAASVSQATSSESPSSEALQVNHVGLTGGQNLLPASIEGHPPYFKSNYLATSVNGSYNTMGQHVLASHSQACFGVGDCLMGSQGMLASGGFRDEADEGAHPFDLEIHEDSRVFQGTCATGCTAGSTLVKVLVTANPGTQGEGRFLMDTNPAKAITAGTLTGGAVAVPGGPGATATFSGTSFPVSVFLQTAEKAVSQARNMAPGTVVLGIATAGVPDGFLRSTAGLPGTSGVACVVDQPNGFNPSNYEMAAYTVVDATHLRMTLNKPHAAGATVAAGGLCGYGLEQKVDTTAGIRQVFPVIGSSSATGLWYAGHLTSVVGVTQQTSGYVNVSLPIASIARAGGVVTVTTATNFAADLNGLTLNVAGVADASFRGSFAVTTTGPNALQYSNAGPDAGSSGGTLTMVTGAFGLYPMAEVLGVVNPATQGLDGTMTLAPNTVPWGANDAVEQPHYFEEKVQPDQEFLGQVVPRPTEAIRAGMVYEQSLGPGFKGWTIQNAVPASAYFGNGGTHAAPDVAYEAFGVWNRAFEVQAGEIAAMYVHCNSHGCGRWNSGYDLFQLDSNVGIDTVHYQPRTSEYTLSLRGASYGFAPGGFTAGVVNAGTLNASTVNAGAVHATDVDAGSGTVQGGTVQAGTLQGKALSIVSDTTAPQVLSMLAPSLGAGSQFCQGFGRSVSAHNATFYCWWNTATPYASLETYAGGDPLQLKGSSVWLNGGPVAIGSLAAVGSALPGLLNVGPQAQFQVDASGNVKAANFAGILPGTTGVIGGASLPAGGCATGGVAVSGAVVGTPVAVSAGDGSLPSGTTTLSAAVTSPGQVTVQVCAVVAGTPAAKSYNVRVLE